jgi:hypothetical protein
VQGDANSAITHEGVNGINPVSIKVSDMSITNYWANYIKGDCYNGYWILGGIRSASDPLQEFNIEVADGEGATGHFSFYANSTASCT